MEPLTGLDAGFLALETASSRLHVAALLILDPPEESAMSNVGVGVGPASAESSHARTFAAIRSVIEQRLDRVPRLRQRAWRAPFGLQRPVWIDDAELDLDMHVRRAALPAPGGRAELEALVGDVMSRPFDLDRPLWEMVVVEGLAGGQTAVIARLHHAILDGEAGATAMAAFLDLEPGGEAHPSGPVGDEPVGPGPVGPGPVAPGPLGPVPEPGEPSQSAGPTSASMWRYTVRGLARQPEEALAALRRGVDTMLDLTVQNHQLALQGESPPPALFRAPRTSLNGNVTGERRFAALRVPIEDLEFVRGAFGDPGNGGDVRGAGRARDARRAERAGDTGEAGAGGDGADALARPTVNDVILCAVGGALMRYLGARGETPSSSLVALVPVSTRRRQVPAPGTPASVGNDVSGMLVPLATTVEDPLARLDAIARSSRVAKAQEQRVGGDLLETVVRAVSPVVFSTFMRGAGALRLFDRVPPPFNVTVSSVVVPDVSLWWAGRPVVDVYPVGPVADGFGLNVTAMTYRGSVHFGLLAAPRLVPDVDELAVDLDDAVAELVLAALGGGAGGQGSALSRGPR